VIRREHRVELASHGPDEHRICGERTCRAQRLSSRSQHPFFFVTEQAGFAGMRIHGAHRNARLLDTPPPAQRLDHGPAGSDNPLSCQQRRNIPEGNMRCHEHHAERMADRIVGHALSCEHHGDIDVAGEVCQPLGMTGIREACEVEGVLVSGGRDDGVYFSTERESDRGLDGVAGDSARTNDAVTTFVGISTAQAPYPDRDSALRWYAGNLVFGTYEGDLGVERLNQRAGGNLGPDPARITQRYRESRRPVRS
jgi:hypothetical protein